MHSVKLDMLPMKILQEISSGNQIPKFKATGKISFEHTVQLNTIKELMFQHVTR
jgi:hypothetical protein